VLHQKSKSKESCQLLCGDEIMKQICKKENIRLIDVNLQENFKYREASDKDYYINRSYYAGNNEIFLGIYDNKEFRFISFFHELGHCLSLKHLNYKYCSQFVYEIEAWHQGLKYARNLGIYFSDEALEWGYKEALTYIGWNKREVDNWKENHSE